MIGVGCVLPPLVVSCADSDKEVRRLGFLAPGDRPSDAEIQQNWAALRQLGWIEGKNIAVARLFTDREDNLPSAARELVQLGVEMIITDGTQAALAAKDATTTIPIVMWGAGDPVAMGIVPSLAHPGGNITGYCLLSSEISVKRALLLHELMPAVRVVASPVTPTNPISRFSTKEAEAAYRAVEVRLILIDAGSALQSFPAEASRQGAQVLDVPGLFPGFMARARQYHQAVIVGEPDLIRDGALMSYGVDPDELTSRVAAIIDKILRGAKPADIPVEQPTKFKLVINVKAAAELGITVPQSIRLQANEVIE